MAIADYIGYDDELAILHVICEKIRKYPLTSLKLYGNLSKVIEPAEDSRWKLSDRKSYRGERVNDETFMPSCLRQGRFFIKLLRQEN